MDLISRSQAGDEEAFGLLFHQYKNMVYKTAYLMLGSPDEAEDVLQEVFLRVHESLSTFESSRGAFTTWLHRITVNHCLNRRRKRQLFVFSLDEVSPASVTEDSPSPEDRLAEEEAVQQALSRLSGKLRTAIILRYYWEVPYAEIALILDIPLGTVKSRLNLGLKTLRKELEGMTRDTPARKTLAQTEVAK